MSYNRIVIVHPEWGVYLGSCLGLGFFSAMDCGGQDSAAVFIKETDARDHVRSWSENNDPDHFNYRVVQTADTNWAEIEELESAGLSEWTVSMRVERERGE